MNTKCLNATCNQTTPVTEWASPEQQELVGRGWSFGTDGTVTCPRHDWAKAQIAIRELWAVS